MREKWYFRQGFLWFIFLSVGPLVLFLIWPHPRYSVKTKIILSAGVLVISYAVGALLAAALQSIMGYSQTVLQGGAAGL